MIEHERRKSRHVFRSDGIIFAGELLQSGIDVEGVPENNNVHDQAQRPQLILLALAIPLAQLPSFAVEDGAGELVPILASI